MVNVKKFFFVIVAHVLCAIPIVFSPGLVFGEETGRFESPLRFKTIEEFIEGVLQAFVYIALPVVAFFVVLSGFKFIAAQGDPSKLKTARENFVHVIIGSALVLGAWAAAALIKGTIDQLRG